MLTFTFDIVHNEHVEHTLNGYRYDKNIIMQLLYVSAFQVLICGDKINVFHVNQ